MSNKTIAKMVLLAGIAFAAPAFAADEPSMHQVYQAAESGHLSEAQQMMQQVLQAHPDSAKAHYVEAELLAKQGQYGQAQSELATAEKLSPGLSFAKPASVQELRSLINHHGAVMGAQASRAQGYANAPIYSQPTPQPSFPWGLVFIGLGIIAVIVIVARRRSAPPAAYPMDNGTGFGRYGNMGAGQAYPQGYPPGYSGAAPVQGGLGSTIMTGLATGAAVGAGMVAGEALAHHFTDDDRREHYSGGNQYVDNPMNSPQNDDMGGTDFGINDTSSWDSGGGGGGDWDN